MKIKYLILLLVLFPLLAYPYSDESHFSEIFGETRNFRVFTPPSYNPNLSDERYPVIYYFHGCGGSYQRSGTYSYADYGLTAPVAINQRYDSTYAYPNNAELENFVYHNRVIIISVDGSIDGLPGCGVYFPSQVDSWEGNYYNFSSYIRELISVIDRRYHTFADAQHRAISGLSMGGNMALWVAATNPHLFSSISEFCHSPGLYDVGEPSYQTTVDMMQLWRNFRGVSVRHTTTDGDYIRYYTEQLAANFNGAGFKNEYYLADFCKHYAARIDLQFAFHQRLMTKPKQTPACFSSINLYPDFEVWGYKVSSSKKGNGWIYLHDVSKNGFGIYTRKRLPFANSLSRFDITLTTPEYYLPNGHYTISRYSYLEDSFSSEEINADAQGKLIIASSGGAGEEIGIIGDGLQPPIFVLTDSINENVYLNPNVKSLLSFDVINLSASDQTIKFTLSTESTDLLSILSQPKSVHVPAKSKIHVSDMAVIKANLLVNYNHTGYIKISTAIDGVVQEREQIIQVVVANHSKVAVDVKIFDGKSEELDLFKYQWNEWDHPFSSGLVAEGVGDGDGKAEIDEIFSIWIRPELPFDPSGTATWHPSIPINGKNNPDITVEDIKQHRLSTGRSILSAQIRLNRSPIIGVPVRVPIQVEWLKVNYLEDDCHRNTADRFDYSYHELVIYYDGTVGIEKR